MTSSVELGNAAERRAERSHAGASELVFAGKTSWGELGSAAERRAERSHAGAWERGFNGPRMTSPIKIVNAAERRGERSHAGAWERGLSGSGVFTVRDRGQPRWRR